MLLAELLGLIRIPELPLDMMPENLVMATRKRIKNTINTLEAIMGYSNNGDKLINTVSGQFITWDDVLKVEFEARIQELELELAGLETS